jgi:hypothetical protein
MAPKTWILVAVVFASAPALAAAPPVGYATATGYFKKETRPTLYQPLNVLDGREITAWCTSSADSLSDQLRFGFKGNVRIDEVRIYTGNGADDASFQEFSRAKKFSLKSPTNARTFTVADQRGLQQVAIRPPLTGAYFSMEILDQYPAEDPESPVCVTDVVFYSDGKPLNGPWLTQKLKYDKQKAPLLGTWFSGYEGAPERFLSFNFDGTYRYDYQPIDQNKKARSFSGDFEVSGNRLVLEVPGKGKVTLKIKRERVGEEGAGSKRVMTFEGKDLPDDLKDTFRDQP